MPKATAALTDTAASFGEGRGFREQLWSPDSPIIAVCKVDTPTVGSELLLDEIERHPGRRIAGR